MRVKRPGARWSRFLGAAILIAALAAGASGASCGDDDRPTTPDPVQRPTPDARLVVLTDLKGYLEPCGCTSRPLGGIDRTAARLQALRAEGPPVVVVAAGDLLFDGVEHTLEGAEAQQLWKAETLVEILEAVELDAATPGRLDLSHGVDTFRRLVAQADFPVLAAGLRFADAAPAEGGPEGGPEASEAQEAQEAQEASDAPVGQAGGEDAPAGQTGREDAPAGQGGGEDAPPAEGGAAGSLGDGIVVDAGGVRIGILGVSDVAGPDGALPPGIERTAEMREAARAAAAELRERGAEVLVALVRGQNRRAARQIATGVEGLDFVVQAGLDEVDPIPPSEAGGSWLLHAGRQGQGMVVVDLFHRGDDRDGFTDWSDWTFEEQRTHLAERIADLRERVEEWEQDDDVPEADLERQRTRLAEMERELAGLSPPRTVEGDAFAARYEELPPEAPQAPAISRLMERHFRRVNDHNREVFADLEPPPVAEGQPSYVGSAACQECHEAENAWWAETPHGRAYPTLVERHKQFNLDCVGCHVTGYQEPGGSTVTHLGEGGVLKNVGCETCHGPGSAHARAEAPEEVATVLDPPESVCVECHNSEHSDTFDYRAYRAMLLSPGHGMPTSEERAEAQRQPGAGR